MGILILASKDVQIWMRDAVFSSANFGIDDSISKLTDAQGLIRHLINQRRVCLQWGVFGDWNNRELPSSIMAFGHKISRLQWKLIHKVLSVFIVRLDYVRVHTHTYLQYLPRMELLFQFISHMSHSRWFPQFICLCWLKWGFTRNIPKWFSSLLLIFLVVGLSALWNQRWEGVPRF